MTAGKGFCDLGFAKIDTARKKRKGFAEVIYCPGKNRLHLKEIAKKIIASREDLLLTKLDKTTFSFLKKKIPVLKYNPLAKIGYYLTKPKTLSKGLVLVVSAGTADIPIAEEAVQTLLVMGNRVERLYDVGVAGVHRLMNNIDKLRKAQVIVVVAGMEGALASLVSGLVKAPIVAVPTSCGYGSSFSGLAALLTMLNGCSPGVSVVNIDNGFGAGYFASLINRK
ncbi:MAG: nickel pincer cofactor biosynthesis protein LarB [Candidatus Omnitrophica bacterium]|nr:nickel pincer cofactor biosynthesis protein LarB [Candidatus Omnitrophota bacterium]MBU4303383.1 nickel pincer cofactor biosynthesis protein LarB [Candidatus Omnitrophota bacterium]MBU4418447.1 nickel pincer cofactor biosynthesis protein LarB [Candidatus Omnitrophota bacterium]MBU4468769.1 nickel pincer cofactor biosynthesis protein LarB [Candidatus Omnitrophota bacterium]MCG2708056.1 nickel pincer cofactor biosynthesis protein LarB [Candidatus Omnitrophota bacterium]